MTEVPPALFVKVRRSPVEAVTVTPTGLIHSKSPPGETARPSDAARKSGTPLEAGRVTWTSFVLPAAAVTRMCNSLGIDFYQMTTERPLELALFDFLNARLRRGRKAVRRMRRSMP